VACPIRSSWLPGQCHSTEDRLTLVVIFAADSWNTVERKGELFPYGSNNLNPISGSPFTFLSGLSGVGCLKDAFSHCGHGLLEGAVIDFLGMSHTGSSQVGSYPPLLIALQDFGIKWNWNYLYGFFSIYLCSSLSSVVSLKEKQKYINLMRN
jgi:hypothetical protein